MSIIKDIYYLLSSSFFKFQISEMGINCKLRLEGRVIDGKYVHFANDIEIEKNWIIAVYPEYEGQENPVKKGKNKGVFIGSGNSFNRNLTIYCADSIVIGENNLFGSFVLITDNDHGTNASLDLPYRFQHLTTDSVTIGNNCWIAENVKILKGSRIGDRCIIAANSLVKGEFDSYTVIAGVPAKVIKRWNFEKCRWEKGD